LRPSLDLEEINTRLDFISVFVQQENMIPLEKLGKSLAKIKNMRVTTTLLRKGIGGSNQKYGGFKSGVWASLLEFAYHTIDIRNTLREVMGGENLLLCAKAMDILDVQKLQQIGKAVHEVVDLESSIEQHRTVVKRGVNERLDEIKDIYDGMDGMLSKAAVAITRTLPTGFQPNLNVIYIPQLGYHITVPINTDTGQPVYDGGDTAWERMFTTQNQAYFKDNRMRELDEQLGDLWAMICG
jgi:DNA mismatch repair protein MSH5